MIIEVKDVSVKFMTGNFRDIGLKEYLVRKVKKDISSNEFCALDNINFSINKGDMLGVVGTNGAGKSTLLKVITGVLPPTNGTVNCKGTISALLELATGFDGDLTVKENTYLRGALLGYSRQFMNETYDAIIQFAELEEFQDRSFKHLSSGMKSRLAFAIASLVNPEILILDEVLAVGDGSFRDKSETKMKEIINNGATTIMVSHSIPQIRRMSNKVLWINKGKQIAFGDTKNICDEYEKYLKTRVLPNINNDI